MLHILIELTGYVSILDIKSDGLEEESILVLALMCTEVDDSNQN